MNLDGEDLPELAIERLGHERHPWDRQFSESRKAFEAFTLYLQAGPNRSLVKVAREYGKNVQSMERWSRRHGWQERVGAWSAHEARVVNAKILESRTQSRLRRIALGQQLQSRGSKGLQRVRTDDLKPTEAARLMQIGAAIEAQAMQLDFDDEAIAEFPVDLPGPTFVIQVINLPPLESHARIQMDGDPKRPGVVAREHLDRFLIEYPSAKVIA